jgi:hypothetical protein
MSLASANRMWAVYSAASSSALVSSGLNSVDQSSRQSTHLRRSMAASAARSFVSSLPYAVENHAGIDLEVLINGERKERRKCQNGTVEYFRFEPPAGKGSGGKRLYGQDVKFEKSVSLFIGNSSIQLPHIDSLLGKPKTCHKLENCQIVMTDVAKEGKTIVSALLKTLIPNIFGFTNYRGFSFSTYGLGCAHIQWNRSAEPDLSSFLHFSISRRKD